MLLVFTAGAVAVAAIVSMGRLRLVPPEWTQEGGDQYREPPQRDDLEILPLPTPTTSATGDGPPALPISGTTVLTVILIVAAALVAVVLWRMRSRFRFARQRSRVVGGEPDPFTDDADELRHAVESASQALHRRRASGSEAIIDAWLALESAAASSGIDRSPAETPSEFTDRLLRHHQADGTAVTQLKRLYHRARFATDPDISDDDVTSAGDALAVILRTLGTPTTSTPDQRSGP